MSRRSRRKSRQLSRADTRRQLKRSRKPTPVKTRHVKPGEPVWCDCCQDAPATVRTWICGRCGFVAIAPLDVALADPEFEVCPNCEGEP